MENITLKPHLDLLVFSHLRWNFVFQRPQHLMTRFARSRRVYFVEEPVFGEAAFASLDVVGQGDGLKVVTPQLPRDLSASQAREELERLVSELIFQERITDFVSWYYTPMALPFTRHLYPQAVVYDCMDELSLFRGAPAQLVELEEELLGAADVVFTGGQSLYEAKQTRHKNIHPFPSSIERAHFAAARDPGLREKSRRPADQARIAGTKVGFCGVIDERMDLELVAGVAKLRPDWNLIMIGPVVKIDPASLPRASNLHYLGMKPYAELPQYLSGWDLAILPFARNEATRFISPTKTPEYLAAGLPVVSTSIRDVIRPYGEEGLVYIADSAEDFVRAGQSAMDGCRKDAAWLKNVDAFLAPRSWDSTAAQMEKLIARAVEGESFEMPLSAGLALKPWTVAQPVLSRSLRA